VATFHNQRDYIFVRHHRYVFEEGKQQAAVQEKESAQDTNTNDDAEDTKNNQTSTKPKNKNPTRARLQELGPRFTLKLKWIQEGTFDTQFGEYEWFHKRKEMDVTRRKFHL